MDDEMKAFIRQKAEEWVKQKIQEYEGRNLPSPFLKL